jgi:peptidoglycan/LPS O-acetylase OafA/YrhL
MSSPVHIPALTGIRAVAAGMVFYGHMLVGHQTEIPDLMRYGWTGVNIFFALSGYLFTYLYSDKLLNNTFSWSDYIKRRLIRIYPLTTLLICLAVLSQWGEYSIPNILLHLTLLQAWVPDIRLSLISPMWTLTVEESFYFSAPILIYALGSAYNDVSRRIQHSNSTTRFLVLTCISVLLWLGTLVFANGAVKLYQNALVYFTNYWDNEAWTFTILGRIVDFVSGMLAASIARHHLPKKNVAGDAIVIIGVCLYIAALTCITSMGGPNGVGAHRLGIIAQNSVGAAAAVIIYGLHSGGIISRVLGSKPMHLMGEASFALYLLQLMPLLWWPKLGMQIFYNMQAAGMHHYVAATVSYVVINLVSIGVFFAFERPVSRYLRHRFLQERGLVA